MAEFDENDTFGAAKAVVMATVVLVIIVGGLLWVFGGK